MTNVQNLAELDSALLDAHRKNDHGKLIDLYSQAGASLIEVDIDGACFYYTHALVFALESGDPRAEKLREILVKNGREEAI